MWLFAPSASAPAGSLPAVLNPAFVEALMGFPARWSDPLKPLAPTACARSETPSSLSAQSERSSCSQGGP